MPRSPKDFQHAFGDLLAAMYPGPHHKELRAQILRETIMRKLPMKTASERQMRALHDAAEESIAAKNRPQTKRPASWMSARKRRGFPRKH